MTNNLAEKTAVDMIHINANYMDIHGRASDHDPVLVQVEFDKKFKNDGIVAASEVDLSKSIISIKDQVLVENGDVQITFTEEAVNKIDRANKEVIIDIPNSTFSITVTNFDILAKKGEFTLHLDYQVPKGLTKEKNEDKQKQVYKLKDIGFTDSQNTQITDGFKDYFIIQADSKKNTIDAAYYDQNSKKWKFKQL